MCIFWAAVPDLPDPHEAFKRPRFSASQQRYQPTGGFWGF